MSLAFVDEAVPPPPGTARPRSWSAAREEDGRRRPLRSRRSLAVSVAAVVAVAASAAAVGFGIWAATLHHSLASERAATRVLRNPLARHIPLQGTPGELVVAPTGEAVLTVAPAEAAEGKYVRGVGGLADRAPCRHLQRRHDQLKVRVPRGAQVMVTLERAGGTSSPSRQPLLSART